MFRFKIIIANVLFDYLAVKSYFNKWTKLSIGIDFGIGIGIDQNSWYRTGIVSKPKKLVSPITTKVVRSLFLAPPLRATSCNVHYSGSIRQ